ncbi:toll/interleukin-1 receptor domain-containing protein, partial [Methylobacterium sp. WL7]|uniref:toll/interleukin-1 receptor domain-containing protein n=1 Tax=Methylobacterium sp. WL7 TaxID=2603900 RepID=UPI0011CBB05C
MLIPTGFWSYTSSDENSSRGKLSLLRSLLSQELQQQIGRRPTVVIWQDVAAIPPGSEWEQQIRSAIGETSFIIPIITPAFLQSEWCSQEIDLFRLRENELKSKRLIFPIHFIDTSHIEERNPDECYSASTLQILKSRQWVDFRNLRLQNYESAEVGQFLEHLAKSIRSSLREVDKSDAPRSKPTINEHLTVGAQNNSSTVIKNHTPSKIEVIREG